MADDDSFADHPISIAEARADREHNSSKWSPRDALISVLRELDSGVLKAAQLIVCVGFYDEHKVLHTRQFVACGSTLEFVGLVELAKIDILEAERR